MNRVDYLVDLYRTGNAKAKAAAVRGLNEQMSAAEVSVLLHTSTDVVESMLDEAGA